MRSTHCSMILTSTRLRIHLRRSVTHLSIGLLKQAIYEMKLLSSELDVDLLNKCQMLYSSWLLETGETFEDFKEAYEHIKTMPTVSNCLIGEMKRSNRKISNSTSLFMPNAVVNAIKEDSVNLVVLRMLCDVNIQLISCRRTESSKSQQASQTSRFHSVFSSSMRI